MMLRFVCVVVCLFLLSVLCAEEVYFVSEDGFNGRGCGAREKPCGSIASALNQMPSNASSLSFNILPGEYSGPTNTYQIFPSIPITIQKYGETGTVSFSCDNNTITSCFSFSSDLTLLNIEFQESLAGYPPLVQIENATRASCTNVKFSRCTRALFVSASDIHLVGIHAECPISILGGSALIENSIVTEYNFYGDDNSTLEVVSTIHLEAKDQMYISRCLSGIFRNCTFGERENGIKLQFYSEDYTPTFIFDNVTFFGYLQVSGDVSFTNCTLSSDYTIGDTVLLGWGRFIFDSCDIKKNVTVYLNNNNHLPSGSVIRDCRFTFFSVNKGNDNAITITSSHFDGLSSYQVNMNINNVQIALPSSIAGGLTVQGIDSLYMRDTWFFASSMDPAISISGTNSFGVPTLISLANVTFTNYAPTNIIISCDDSVVVDLAFNSEDVTIERNLEYPAQIRCPGALQVPSYFIYLPRWPSEDNDSYWKTTAIVTAILFTGCTLLSLIVIFMALRKRKQVGFTIDKDSSVEDAFDT